MDHYNQLRSFLSAVRRRWFAQELLWVVSRAAAAASVPAISGLVLYRLFTPEGIALVVLASAAVVAALAAATLVIVRMPRRPTERQVARFIEERASAIPGAPAFDDTLVTAVDCRSAASPAFGPLLVAAALERLQSVSPNRIVPRERLRRLTAEAAAGVAVLAVLLAFAVEPLGRALETARFVFLPGTIQVDVHPGDARVVAGQPVQIRATFRAGDRPLSRLAPALTVSARGGRRTVPMRADGEAFVVPFESVDRTFRYTVTAGGAASREFTITALFPPRVERIDLSYTYPAFTGLNPRDERDAGDIYAPAGTRVRVRVHTDKPVVSGAMSFGGGTSLALTGGDDRVLETELVLARDDSYRLQLADADGLTADGGTEYFIRLVDDRPPDVRIVRPAGDQRITPLEEVAIEARADDDHGVASLELVYSIAGGAARAVPFSKITANGSARTGAHVLAAEELGVKPGDVITYYAKARDVGRGKRPTETRSDMYFLEVRPFGEEFVAAQTQGGGGGAASARIESLIAAQKEIINATWTVERRSGAGRSSKDIAAIALAQAELKARAEQMASRRGPGGFDFPQQIGRDRRQPRAPRGEGVAGAIAAMSRAVDHLQGERTKDALSQEMTALQALLQVQAEIRRREVAMQQAAGGSGGDRANEDLSALFDKELQRQQSTRYETRSRLDERPERGAEESALDRIRDLARRQEDLARRQRELAERELSDDERKRQLERLTREQAELRRQLEDMASRRQPGEDRGLREASEQMRNAAGALGRDDARGASEQSARAAGQLRQLEESMQAGSRGARERAAGDLQLEAQQIAEAQRRIASEASRLDKADRTASADARRRLAGEKEGLADRVDRLERAATALAREATGTPDSSEAAGRIGRAARQLEQQRIGQRMRETAAQLREGGTGRSAGAEEQLAEAVDRVAEGLAAGGNESRTLASVLDRTRAIRDRLDRLERQIGEAEARQQGKGAGPGGRSGRQDGGQGSGGAAGGSELERLRQDYARELQRAREALRGLQRGEANQAGAGGGTPEEHEWSHADAGVEAHKQDFSGWQSLRKDIDLAIERTEAAVSARLARQAAQDRLNAGGSDRVPGAYERLIARYYESLARRKK